MSLDFGKRKTYSLSVVDRTARSVYYLLSNSDGHPGTHPVRNDDSFGEKILKIVHTLGFPLVLRWNFARGVRATLPIRAAVRTALYALETRRRH